MANNEIKQFSESQLRNSGLTARLGLLMVSIDARAFIPILFLLFNISWVSFYIFIGSVTIFSMLEYVGYSFMVALRKLRSLIAGKKRFVQKHNSRRRRLIYG